MCHASVCSLYMRNEMKTVSDHREEKARMSGDYAAYARDMAARRFAAARLQYLDSNPEVGCLTRNGKEVFYRVSNGDVEEFSPESVVKNY